jgi:hypothetical protein
LGQQHVEDVMQFEGAVRRVAAFISEPIVGANGIIVPPDGYWQKGKPHVDGVEWLIVADPLVRLASFKAGESNVTQNVEPKDAKQLEAEGKYRIATLASALYALGLASLIPQCHRVSCPTFALDGLLLSGATPANVSDDLAAALRAYTVAGCDPAPLADNAGQ